jgi:hypothetical protein
VVEAEATVLLPTSEREGAQDSSDGRLLEDSILYEGQTWVGLHFTFHLENVTLALLDNASGEPARPLATFALVDSQLSFTSYTDGTPREIGSSITLYARDIAIHDSRQQPALASNCFRAMLTPMGQVPTAGGRAGGDAPQLQITARTRPMHARVQVVLNQARVILLPQWLQLVGAFLGSRPESGFQVLYAKHKERLRGRFRTKKPAPKPGKRTGPRMTPARAQPEAYVVHASCTVTDPEFVLVNDVQDPKSDALVLRFCNVTRLESNAFAHEQGPPEDASRGNAQEAPASIGRAKRGERTTLESQRVDISLDVRRGRARGAACPHV